MPARFVIIDRSLKDERGHHYALTQLITSAAQQHGVEVLWWANEGFPTAMATPGVQVHGIFHTSIYDQFQQQRLALANAARGRRLRNLPLRIARRIYNSVKYRLAVRGIGTIPEPAPVPDDVTSARLVDELAHGLECSGIRAGDHLFVHTADGDLYRAVLDLFVEQAFTCGAPCVHLVTPYDPSTMPHYHAGLPIARVIRFFDMLGLLGSRVFLYAENAALAAVLRDAWNAPVATLCLPPPLAATEPGTPDPERLCIVYPGAARVEKGFRLLPDVITRVIAAADTNRPVTFIVQCNAQIVGYSPEIELTIDRLRQFGADTVYLVESTQSMDEYYAMLRSADVVLACYDAEKYRVRGSGVAVEAVAFGKTLIATPGTFPAQLAGECAICATGVDEIVDAILEVSRDPDVFRARAAARRNAYFDEHRVEDYVAGLIAAGAQVPPWPTPPDRMKTDDERTQQQGSRGHDWREALKQASDGDGERPPCRRLLGRSAANT